MRWLSAEAGGTNQTGALAAFARLHPRFGTPANAVLLQTGMALLVLMLGAFDRILAFIIFSAVVFLALTVATLFRTITPVRRWWYPLAPIVFIAGSGVLAIMLLMHSPGSALLGAGVVLCRPSRPLAPDKARRNVIRRRSRYHLSLTTIQNHRATN